MSAIAFNYHKTGLVVIPEAIAKADAADVAVRALAAYEERAIRRDGESSGGGRSSYFVFDGSAVSDLFPELREWYVRLRGLAEEIVGVDVSLSPHARSAVNVKVYPGPTSGQGWHLDTNPVSALLYLSGAGTPTRLVGLDGRCYEVAPRPGRLLLFQGRSVLHCVPEGPGLRVTAPLNFYHPWDMDRPEWIDEAIYENVDPPRRTEVV